MGFLETFLLVLIGGAIEDRWRIGERVIEGVTGQDVSFDGIAAVDEPLW